MIVTEYDGNNVTVYRNNSNGDFRSPECIEILKTADIVVTNPPFSLFREYIAQLIEYGKKFLIIGNKNAVGDKDIFPLVKDNKMWLGNGFKAGNAYFRIPDGTDTAHYAKGVYDDETKTVKFRNACWFTNMDHEKRHEGIDCIEKYDPKKYPKYDGYDAIEVAKVLDIPVDYNGIMGVPITFLDKYDPDQFEIVGLARYTAPKEVLVGGQLAINGKSTYHRILIRRK